MVNIELFVNINNPRRLESAMPPKNTTCSCSIYKNLNLWSFRRPSQQSSDCVVVLLTETNQNDLS